MSTASLECSCGMILKLAGARPGRVGKCPRCGAMFRVPEPVEAPPPPLAREPEFELPIPGAFVERPDASAKKRGRSLPPAAGDQGPIKPPRKLESHVYQSVPYPLWSWSSIAVLCFLPPTLTFVTSPVTFLIQIFLQNTPFTIAGLVLSIPVGLICLCVMGYVLIYLSNVLTSSSFGEPMPPRSPTWSGDEVFRILGRWFWALFAGVAVGFVPAVAYWIQCGELDWSDHFMLFNLYVVGVAYSQMALLAALLHDDPFAANPITVIRALRHVGFDYVFLSLLTAFWVIAVVFAFARIQEVQSFIPYTLLSCLFWFGFLYSAMVMARCQGLFARRNKVVQKWFPYRPMWGR